MELAGGQDELQKFYQSVLNLTEKAMPLIKQERIRKNEPFDKSFMESILSRTKSR